MDTQRPMFDVDMNCGECGAHITRLPFEPSGDRPVFCMDCLKKRRESRPERRMFDVDINCAECGTHISQLPFEPSLDRPVYCRACNAQRRR